MTTDLRPNSRGSGDYFVRHTTLRQIQLFESVVRQGSFTKAAEELFLSQPSVSMQIKKLTETVGMPLVQHVGRRVEPTDAGQTVYQACVAILKNLGDLEVSLDDFAGLKQGRLRLAVITTAKYFAPEILGEFCAEHPGIDVSLEILNREKALERIANNEDDVYVLGQPRGDEQDVEYLPFAPNPLVIIAKRENPLVGEKNISLERIAQENFIMREPGSGVRDAIIQCFENAGLAPRLSMVLGSNEAIKHAVLGGLGVAGISLNTLILEGTEGPLAVLDVQGFPICRRWYLAYSRKRELSLVAKAFLQFAQDREETIGQRLEKMLPMLKGRY